MVDDARSQNEASLMLTAELAGALLGMSAKALRRADQADKIPAPMRIGRNVRWRRQELIEWMEAGCPDRPTWRAIRDARWRDAAG